MTHKHLALALIPIIGASVLMAADIFGTRKTTISRPWLRDGTNYTVNFDYDPLGGGSIPATIPPGQMHYPASVSVWANGQQVGTNFFGEVTEKGCFEDRPEDMVAKALSQNLAINAINSIGREYRITNISPMVFYYTNHEVFIVDSRWGPTNIVISNDYSGTIQIGTNFWRVDDLLRRHREWSLVFSNGYVGPFGVYRYGGKGINGLFLIDYSTNHVKAP